TVPDAAHLGGAPPSAYQQAVSGSCQGQNAISQVNANGSVGCTPTGTGTLTGVTAGTGLTGGGSSGNVNISADETVLQHRLTSGCSTGEALNDIGQNGNPTCFAPPDTTVMTGSSNGNLTASVFLPPSGAGGSANFDNVAGIAPVSGDASNLTVSITA